MTMKTRSFCKRSTFVLTGISWLGSLCLAIALCGSPAHAQGTFTAASCNRSDVNAVINGPTHTAVNGDTIVIPATGSPCTWTSGITISGKGIDITGTGNPNSGGGTTGAGTSNTTIIDNISNPGILFAFTNLSFGQTAKIELLTLSASGAGVNSISGPMEFSGTCTSSGCANFRVDNINFSAGTWESPVSGGLVVIDNVFGVVDHNTVNEATSDASPLVQVNYSSWQGVGNYGDNSFASADTFGTAQTVYIENNLISGIQASQNDVAPPGLNAGGARWVCRFNTVPVLTGSSFCSGHGTAWTGRPRGQRQVESYYNNITVSAGHTCDSIHGMNGGAGIYLSNSISAPGAGCNKFVAVDNPMFIKNVAPWGLCSSTNAYNQYPCSATSAYIDQPGSGAGGLLENLTSPVLVSNTNCATAFASSPSTANSCWPNPTLDPIYEAGDVMTAGGLGAPVVIASDGTSTRVLFNRDVYAEVSQAAQTSSTSPFNGTTGTGYGTLANRPTTCTAGVGYWATDQGTWNTFNSQEGIFYTCNVGGNAWSVYYTPYTYPHPLEAGGTTVTDQPPNPSNLTATVQ